MTTLLAINPYCRDGDTGCDAVREALSERGEVQVHRLSGKGTLAERIARIGDALERIVVAGGDGTLHRALPDVLAAGVPLGVLPLGTANDFARTLALPDDPLEAADVIVRGHTRRVDLGVVNDRYFLNAVGIGLGPDLTRELDREKKKRLGVLAYLDSLLAVIGRRRRRRALLRVDDRRQRLRFLQITIANGRHYGGGMTVCDDVELDDATLHVLCLRPLTPWQLFLRGLRLRFGAVDDDHKMIHCKGRDVEVTTRSACDVTADGELVTHTPVCCRVRPGALRVFAPDPEATRPFGSHAADAEVDARPPLAANLI